MNPATSNPRRTWRSFMNRRTLFIAGFCALVLVSCHFPGQTELAWDEEVQLPDGRQFTVHMVHSFHCYNYRFRRFGGDCGPNDSTLTLKSGDTPRGVTQLFKGFQPMFLGEKAGVWYAILIGGYRYKNREIPGQDWGDQQGPYDQWAIRLVNGKWQPMPLIDFPPEFQKPNMLLYGTAQELSKFHQGRVTLQDKAEWVAYHPLGYADVQITRPKPSAQR